MPATEVKKLSSLFRSTFKATSSLPKTPPPPSAPLEDLTLWHHLDNFSTSTPANCLFKFRKGKKRSKTPPSISVKLSKNLSQDISNYIVGTSSNRAGSPNSPLQDILELSGVCNLQNSIILRRKELYFDKKKKWGFNVTQGRRFVRLVKMCGETLGTTYTLGLFGKLRRETGINEYNALVELCIKKSKATEDEEIILEQIHLVFQLFKSMSEQGFQLEEATYGQFLTFLINMEMVEEFKFFSGVIQDENPSSLPRLAYYEMLLWVRLEDEDNIKELCDYNATNDGAVNTNIRENYFLALCESEREEELLMLSDVIEITKISSMAHLTAIFRSLARLLLETLMKKFIVALKSCYIEAENISKLIYDYAITMPNLSVQDAILKFKTLHEELDVMPASASYEKLIDHCCSLLKVHAALDVVDHMLEAGLTLSLATFHLILRACEESCDYNLVHRIYSMIRHAKLPPNNEIFRGMIQLSVRIKDFKGAYNMIKDLEDMGLSPTTSMYNIIMAAHFREKNFQAGLMVRKYMECAGIDPDCQTFSYLIQNCDRKEDIIKYYEEAKKTGLQLTKHVFMALINAYASRGQLEKAKQVILEKGIPGKSINEVKSVLVSALASRGQISDALSIYEENKQAEGHAEPKTILCLIESLQSEGKLSRLLDLLNDLNDTDYWIEGCCKVILYCVQWKDLRSTIDLLKQLTDKFYDDDIATEVLFDETFYKIAERENEDLQFGLDLLQSIKEELGICPSRRSLDFLLSACTSAKDSKTARLIWMEYGEAGLPYNGLNYLRMYQVHLACGDLESAKKMHRKIPVQDPHVVCVIKACEEAYKRPKKKEKKKKKEEKEAEI